MTTDFSPFLPTTQNIPKDEKSFDYFLNDQFALIADAVNLKTIGIFSTAEQQNGENWYYGSTTIQVQKTRNGLQTVLFIPSLVSGPIPNPVQNIDGNFIMTEVYGTASKLASAIGAGDGDYFTFVNEGNSHVSFTVSDTTITITTDGSLSAYQAFIVQKYIKSGN